MLNFLTPGAKLFYYGNIKQTIGCRSGKSNGAYENTNVRNRGGHAGVLSEMPNV